MLNLGIKSLWNRRFVVTLTVLSIALSVFLVVGVERVRTSAKDGFASSASGIDLIAAARGDAVQILMGTVFGVGSTGPGIGWDSYEMIADLPEVNWAVPIALGDNHRGFPVVGTTAGYFDHFRHSGGQALSFAEGHAFPDQGGAVIGAEIAGRFGYGVGTTIVNAHGAGEIAFDVHDESPFAVSGILSPTGTAVDRMVYVSLEGFDRLHADRQTGADDPFAALDGVSFGAEQAGMTGQEIEDLGEAGHGEAGHVRGDTDPHEAPAEHAGHEPAKINAVYVGLVDRGAVLSVQRAVNDYPAEPLTAVLPNVALLQLWSITGAAETALLAMASAVAFAGIIGMVVMISASLEVRRREFAILRSVGATPARIFSLIVLESVLITAIGIVVGLASLWAVSVLLEPYLAARFGLRLGAGPLMQREVGLVLAVLVAGTVASVLPAARVYRMTLADGLSFKL